ncbi:hypothetical protein DPEC_G00254120 [Dallia pectoralis]|uniref:Uncharacterized protein n=1 Tax=Dallia pectoralis TaxID=75939 RepID=A0ACC2FU96_DALPE|nr:hypothetical protein DPEC_G00254120 [Dallia pectoralis]
MASIAWHVVFTHESWQRRCLPPEARRMRAAYYAGGPEPSFIFSPGPRLVDQPSALLDAAQGLSITHFPQAHQLTPALQVMGGLQK